MTDRDMFAAAALTGLLSGNPHYTTDAHRGPFCASAWLLADAMLAARGTTDLDAAPAATASGRDSSAEAGTGDARAAPEPAAWAVYDGDEIVRVYVTHTSANRLATKAGLLLFPLYAAPPATGVTLTDADREVLRECADIAWGQLLSGEEGGDEETIARLTRRHALLRGLLARAAKEAVR